MTAVTDPPSRMAPRPARALSRALKWTARVLLVAAALAAAHAGYRRLVSRRTERTPGAPIVVTAPLRKPPVRIDWARERFASWRSPEDGISLRYPLRYDAVRGFGRFTSRPLAGGLVETDVVAFRAVEPRSAIVVAVYRAPRRMPWEAWVRLARGAPLTGSGTAAQSAFAAEFGGSDRTYRRVRLGEREALAVSARGAVRFPIRGNEQWEMWRFESRFLARGDRAVRITAGVHQDQFAGARAGIEAVLASFRWEP